MSDIDTVRAERTRKSGFERHATLAGALIGAGAGVLFGAALCDTNAGCRYSAIPIGAILVGSVVGRFGKAAGARESWVIVYAARPPG